MCRPLLFRRKPALPGAYRMSICEQACIKCNRIFGQIPWRVVRLEMVDKYVLGMVVLRMISGSMELFAAYLMFRFNQVEKALLVNSGLALIGPLVLITTTTIGLVGIADKLSASKLLWITAGVCCLFVGILKK